MDFVSYACGAATVIIVEFALMVALVLKEYNHDKRKDNK